MAINKGTSSISSFDESEFAEQREDAVGEALANIEEDPEVQEENEDPELSDVDLRLETADYYRAILKHEFFDTASSAAQIVDREIRTFIRERLEVLLGLRAPRAESMAQFEEAEVEALKAVAARILERSPAGPAVKKMAPPAVAPKPETKIAQKPKPQVKKIPAPALAPSTKPKAKPGPKPKEQAQQAAAPVAVTKPAAKATQMQVAEPGIEGGVTQTFVDKATGSEVTLIEGQIIEENGRRYKVDVNGHGTLYRRDITGQVAPPNRLPPMSIQAMSNLAMAQAEQTLNSIDDQTGMAIVASLQQR